MLEGERQNIGVTAGSWQVTLGQECRLGTGGETLQRGGRALKGKNGSCMHVIVHTRLQSCVYSYRTSVLSPSCVYTTVKLCAYICTLPVHECAECFVNMYLCVCLWKSMLVHTYAG